MCNIISESCKYNNKKISINLTRFGDCCVMSKKSSTVDERKLYLDHINFVIDKCFEIISDNGEVYIYKYILDKGETSEISIKTLNSIEDANDFKEFVDKLCSIIK